jgi:TatA/E family protein of Tat protein translocase
MFNTPELIVIFIVAFLIFGPKKLPEVAKTLGKGLADLKKSFDEVKEQVQTEVNEMKETSGIKEALSDGAELKRSLQDIKEQVKTDFKETMDSSVAELSTNDKTKNSVEAKKEKEQQGVAAEHPN